MRKISFVITLLLALAVVFSGCAPVAPAADQPVGEDAGEQVNLEWWTVP